MAPTTIQPETGDNTYERHPTSPLSIHTCRRSCGYQPAPMGACPGGLPQQAGARHRALCRWRHHRCGGTLGDAKGGRVDENLVCHRQQGRRQRHDWHGRSGARCGRRLHLAVQHRGRPDAEPSHLQSQLRGCRQLCAYCQGLLGRFCGDCPQGLAGQLDERIDCTGGQQRQATDRVVRQRHHQLDHRAVQARHQGAAHHQRAVQRHQPADAGRGRGRGGFFVRFVRGGRNDQVRQGQGTRCHAAAARSVLPRCADLPRTGHQGHGFQLVGRSAGTQGHAQRYRHCAVASGG